MSAVRVDVRHSQDLERTPLDRRGTLPIPETTVSHNLDVSAARYPSRTAIWYYGRPFSYGDLKREVDALAGYLCAEARVRQGDRVLVFMQNCPQFVIAYHAVLRADAVVVPVNPMNLADEVRHYVENSGARVAIVGSELLGRVAPHVAPGRLETVVVTAYADYAGAPTDLALPPELTQSTEPIARMAGAVSWSRAIGAGHAPGAPRASADDLAVLPYTSGTTGSPKGCIHTHRTLMSTIVQAGLLNLQSAADVMLAVAPFFHVSGMQMVMNNCIFLGAQMVVMTRWDREVALDLIARHEVTSFVSIPTTLIDLLASPRADRDALASLRMIGGGGAAMPEAIAERLYDLTGLSFFEGYGLTETAAPTHSNPPLAARRQCLGTPVFNTRSRVVDPDSGAELPPGQVGEIVLRGPQVFRGYWNDPAATSAAFVQIDGEAWFRTGDLGRMDADGYFYMVDRLKRMINASGYKVWPAEVESMMFRHPDIQEVCVIGSRDAHRGETVKAIVVLKLGRRPTEREIVDWARTQMATYKAPRLVEFVDALPKSGTGKVQWRLLQDRENSAAAPRVPRNR